MDLRFDNMRKIFLIFVVLVFASSCGDLTLQADNIDYNANISLYPELNDGEYNSKKLHNGHNRVSYPVDEYLHTVATYVPNKVSLALPSPEIFQISGINSYSSILSKLLSESNAVEPVPDDNGSMLGTISGRQEVSKMQDSISSVLQEGNVNPITEDEGISKAPIPPAVGDMRGFWVIDYLNNKVGYQRYVTASIIRISPSAIFFLENNTLTPTQTQIEEMVDSFETSYPIVQEKCGLENDVDGNGKVIILLTQLGYSVGGYFYNADKFSNAQLSGYSTYSNEADILYINTDYFKSGNWESKKRDLFAVMIHEFHHMALYDHRQRLGLPAHMDSWINEGLSMLTSYYANLADTSINYVNYFLKSESNTSLVSSKGSSVSYGYVYLFMRYFYARFGDEGIRRLINSPYSDVRAVEYGSQMNFNDLFRDFLYSMLVTGRNITTDPRYEIPEFNYDAQTSPANYSKSSLNVKEILNNAISSYTNDNYNPLLTTVGYSVRNIKPYVFNLKRWKNYVQTITVNSTDNSSVNTYYGNWY